MNQFFSIKKELSTTSARAGVLHTDHGEIKTPFFMPVGTYGAVKTQTSEEIKNSSSPIPITTGLPFLAAISSLGLSSCITIIP